MSTPVSMYLTSRKVDGCESCHFCDNFRAAFAINTFVVTETLRMNRSSASTKKLDLLLCHGITALLAPKSKFWQPTDITLFHTKPLRSVATKYCLLSSRDGHSGRVNPRFVLLHPYRAPCPARLPAISLLSYLPSDLWCSW